MGHPWRLFSEVQVLQKKSIRAICNLSFNAHTNSHFKQANILKCGELYKLNLCSHLFKIISNNHANYVSKYIKSASSVHTHSTRNNSKLIIPRFNLSASQKSFGYQAIKNWNAIPEPKNTSSKFKTFHSNLKKFYLSQY